jgi:Domain of unknown function (DUF1996)/Domain of unknown function (DUF4124)
MVKSNVTLHKLLVLASASLLLISNIAFAQIYKWQNARGVTQYSDIPPATNYSKVTRDELVNAIQSKDVCTLANTKKEKPTNALATNMQGGTFVNNASSSSKQSSSKSDSARSTGSSSSRSSSSGSSGAGSSGSGSSSFGSSGSGSSGAGSSSSLTKSDTPKSPTKLAQNNPAPTNQSAQGSETVPAKINEPATKPTNPVTANNPSTAAPPVQTVAQAAPTATPPKQSVVQAGATTDATLPAPPKPTLANVQAPNIVQVALMPAVDISKNVTPAVGYSDLRIKPTTEQPPIQGGAFRVTCTTSHMSNDDPLVYPNQPGAAHHHTFFGNTTTNAKSDLMTFASTGNSTCSGGIMNRSAYWVPSMIDTKTNTPIVPDDSLFYYKTGDFGDAPSATITAPPKGLRMITGSAKATTADAAVGLYTCISAAGTTTPWKQNIVNCAVGEKMQLHIDFAQCWDGINLDSPDHKSHMSHRENVAGAPARCPSTHPVMIPQITLNINYKITAPNQTVSWRLASDNYVTTSPGGYSTHADWVNGWDEKFMAGIIKNCLQKNADCHAHLLGDGRTYY